MKKWQIILISIFILGIISAAYVWVFVINKSQPDYDSKSPDVVISAKTLFDSYKNDKLKSQKEYNGKVIQIKGNLKKVEDKKTFVVAVFAFTEGDFGDEGIRCTMLPKYSDQLKTLQEKDFVTIKGFCTGYNDTDIIFDKCSLIQ